MKARDVREMNLDELERKAGELKEEFFNLRFQHEIGQLENPNKMKQTKKDIALIKTVIHEVKEQNKTAKE